MRKVLFLSIVSLGLIGFFSLFNQMIKSSKTQVNLPPLSMTNFTEVGEIASLPSNKDSDINKFTVSTVDKAKALLKPEAQNHVIDVKLILFKDYEKTAKMKAFTTNLERQVWQITRKYTAGENYKDSGGTYTGEVTVKNIIDAETGKFIIKSVMFQKFKNWSRQNAQSSPPQVDISTPPPQVDISTPLD